MHRTISQWAADSADTMQYACNLSGLVFAFEQCVEDVAEEARRLGHGDEWINRHPIAVLWIDKLDDLSRSRSLQPIETSETLSALVPKFAAVMRGICEESRQLGTGTDWRNQHPRAQEMVRKLVSVTGSRDSMAVLRAFDSCERLAKGEPVDFDWPTPTNGGPSGSCR